MTMHVATPLPEVPGIDLLFRPPTYFGPLPLETHLLAHVTGHERRELLRAALATGRDRAPSDLLVSTLADDVREAIGRLHPALMGGEYLPPFLENEIEIARISLESTTADQISVRAQRISGCIAYRIVDEYPENGPSYECHPDRSQSTLTLAELVLMIDSGLPDGGAALSHLFSNCEYCFHPRELRNFVRVHSEFYPQLEAYYDHRIGAWFAENHPEIDAEDNSD
jgi:hypothetical protein